MNKLDWIVTAVLAASFLFGYRRGFVTQLVSLLGLFVAWLTAYLFYDDLAPWVGKVIPIETFADYSGYGSLLKGLKLDTYVVNMITFSLILIAVKLGLSIAGHVLNVLAKIPGLNMLNRWSGGLLALVEAVAITAVILHIMALLPNDSIQSYLNGSHAAALSTEWVPVWLGKIKELPSSI